METGTVQEPGGQPLAPSAKWFEHLFVSFGLIVPRIVVKHSPGRAPTEYP